MRIHYIKIHKKGYYDCFIFFIGTRIIITVILEACISAREKMNPKRKKVMLCIICAGTIILAFVALPIPKPEILPYGDVFDPNIDVITFDENVGDIYYAFDERTDPQKGSNWMMLL